MHIQVYPNPYIRGRSTGGIKFSGLSGTRESILRIYTLSGKLVKEYEISPGGEISWDCRNDERGQVSPGLYIYVVTDEGGDNKKTGKIVIK